MIRDNGIFSHCFVDYWDDVSKDPTLEERQELLRKVHIVPGADWYTMANVRTWFKSRRDAEAKRNTTRTERTGLIRTFIAF